MSTIIEVSGFDFKQLPTGEWTFKAKENQPFNINGTLKTQYKELPSLDLIYGIEAHMRGQMDNEIKQASKEILKELGK